MHDAEKVELFPNFYFFFSNEMNALPTEMAEEPLVIGKQGQRLMVGSWSKSQLLPNQGLLFADSCPSPRFKIEIHALIS